MIFCLVCTKSANCISNISFSHNIPTLTKIMLIILTFLSQLNQGLFFGYRNTEGLVKYLLYRTLVRHRLDIATDSELRVEFTLNTNPDLC